MARYKLRQRLVSLGEDYDIEDENGRVVYKVDGKLLKIRETFVLQDRAGNDLLTIREKLVSIRDTMTLEREGNAVASIRKALFSPLRDKFVIELEAGGELIVTGSILDHEYEVRRDDQLLATVSKKWFSIRDSYGIDIRADEDDVLILGAAVAIDELAHDKD